MPYGYIGCGRGGSGYVKSRKQCPLTRGVVMSGPKAFGAACASYFGRHPNQTIAQFSAELKALTHADKLEIAEGMRKNGVDCLDPTEIQVQA